MTRRDAQEGRVEVQGRQEEPRRTYPYTSPFYQPSKKHDFQITCFSLVISFIESLVKTLVLEPCTLALVTVYTRPCDRVHS